MHLFATASLKNKALIALVTIVAMFFGVLSLLGLKQELMPSVQFPVVAVATSYPGASPEVVNSDVSEPIEEAVRGVSGLERTSSTSRTNASMVLLEFEYGTDLVSTEQKVERAISRISQILPEGLEPQVGSGSIDDFPVIQIAVGISEGAEFNKVVELLETLAVPNLEDIDGVRQVQISGAAGERVSITPDQNKLLEAGLSGQSIRDALKQNGVLLPAGEITESNNTMSVQVGGSIESVDEVKEIPLISAASDPLTGQPRPPLKISEVAKVELTSDPVTSISRINGESAVTIAVTKLSSANTVEVSHAVQEILRELEPSFGDASFTVVFDQAPYIEDSIETLAVEGLLGLVFAILVILVFLLSMRATLVTAVSIPTSVLLTFIGLNFADYTLNLLTLGALTISIGRVVDDSIVVIENIKRHLTEDGKTANIIKAVREVAGAITASTIATVAVFLPLAFVSGMVGELFRPFAFTITFALLASLLVSLTIVPVLAYWFLKPDTVKNVSKHDTIDRTGTAELADGSAVTKLQRVYLPVIDWTLKKPGVTLLASLVIFGGTIAAYPLMKTNFLGEDEQNAVNLTQTLSAGSSLDEQLNQVERVEEALETLPEIETIQVTLGGGLGVEAVFGGGGDGELRYSLTTDPNAVQAEVQRDIRETVDALEDAGEFSIGVASGGPTGSSTVDIEVTAPNQELLTEGTKMVVEKLSSSTDFAQVTSNLGESRPTIEVKVDRAAAADSGLSEVALAGIVSQSMQPQAIGQIVLDNSSVKVFLVNDESPTTLDEIRSYEIQTATGLKTLDDLASVEIIDGPVTVTNVDGARSATIEATPATDDLSVTSAVVFEKIAELDLPSGVTAEAGGVLADQEEAFAQLGLALLAAILIVYVVMVATFRSLMQPILLLISVPFAATGAILMLIATGVPLGVASLIGVLMLVGIVVTNAIVLIDLVNQLRERGHGLKDAVRTGSAHRFRPIVMTALATIFALVPMAFGITGKGGFISQPLAVVVIGGLLSSTVLTLVVLPTLYYLAMRRGERKKKLVSKRGSAQ